jgi:hypothetical protein
VGDAARRTLGEEVEQRRKKLIGKHVPHQSLSSSYNGGKDEKSVAVLPKWLETMMFDIPLEPDGSSSGKFVTRDRGFRGSPFLARLFDASDDTSTFAPDEIAPIIHQSVNSITSSSLGCSSVPAPNLGGKLSCPPVYKDHHAGN